MCINIFEGLKKWKTLIGRGELLLLNGCLGHIAAPGVSILKVSFPVSCR
jgi:hypothetical protein